MTKHHLLKMLSFLPLYITDFCFHRCIPLISMSILITIPWCFYYCSSVVHLGMGYSDTSSSSFSFYMKLKLFLSITMKNCFEIFMGSTWNLQINLVGCPFFTLFLPVNEISFHLLISSLISFFNVLNFIIQVFHLLDQSYPKCLCFVLLF